MKMPLFIMLFIFIGALNSNAQEIKATVNVNMDQLTYEARNYVSSMQRDVEGYINSQRFTKADWQGDPIPVMMTIYLSGGANNKYSARVMIISTRRVDGPDKGQSVALKLMDTKWNFEYGQGANLTFNPLRFDKFTTLIDYYMMLVIGYELDSYGELDGSKWFEAAKGLVSLGASQGADGYEVSMSNTEFSRYNLVSELTNMRFDLFRRFLFAYYVDGIDIMYKDKQKGLEAIERVIEDMAAYKKDKLSAPSVIMQLFFDSKADEIASLFKSYPKTSVFDNLKYLDAGNSQLWDEAKEGKSK
jgi:hypothetical protein